MAKFEIYESEKIEAEEPIRWAIKINSSGRLEVSVVNEHGGVGYYVLACIPGEGIELHESCTSKAIGMPVDEKGRVQIIT